MRSLCTLGLLLLTAAPAHAASAAKQIRSFLGKDWNHQRFCVTKDFTYVSLSPDGILSLEVTDVRRTRAGYAMWVNDVDIHQDGRLIQIEVDTGTGGSNNIELLLDYSDRLAYRPEMRNWVLKDGWQEALTRILEPVAEPCTKIDP